MFRNCCTEHEETETKCLEMYEKLKEESKQVEKQRDQVKNLQLGTLIAC